MRKATFAAGLVLAAVVTAGAAATASFADTGSSTTSTPDVEVVSATTTTAATAPTTLACPPPYKATKSQILGTEVLLCAKPATLGGAHPGATETVTATSTVTVTAPTSPPSTTPLEPVPVLGQFCRTQGERGVTKQNVKVICALAASNRLRWLRLS